MIGFVFLLSFVRISIRFSVVITTASPVPLIATSPRLLLTPQTVGLMGPKTGQLIDYGRLLSSRAGPIGWILALVSGLLLLPLALAFAARKCTQGACVPAGSRTGYIPVVTGTTGATQTDAGTSMSDVVCCALVYSLLSFFSGAPVRNTREIQILDQRDDNLAASSGGIETTRIEQTRGKHRLTRSEENRYVDTRK
jgi:hypothetical protein